MKWTDQHDADEPKRPSKLTKPSPLLIFPLTVTVPSESLHPPLSPSLAPLLRGAAREGAIATSMSRKETTIFGAERRQPLLKQQSWSPDIERDEAWTRRKGIHRNRKGQLIRSVTDVDLDELRGCIDLGFGFEVDSPGAKRLSETFPALDLYYAVHRGYEDSANSSESSSSVGSPFGSPLSIVSPGDTPELVKARLKQWAQVVACSVRQRY